MLKLTVIGCTGRMGQITLKEINQNPEVEVAGALTGPGNLFAGQDVGTFIGEGPFNILITDSPQKALSNADVVIDFSRPEAIERNLDEAIEQQKPYVICITGLQASQQKKIEKTASHIPLLLSPNTSLGIAVLKRLALLAAQMLGPSYDVSLLEMHHHHKRDAPSGTSLSIANDLARLNHLKHNVPPYSPLSPRPAGTIECVVLRGGNLTGDHSVILSGEKEVLTLQHRALNPSLFAQGAIKAAQWLYGKPRGLYTMDDVVELAL